MADYPSAIHSESDVASGTKLGGSTPTHRVRHNNHSAEIIAIETVLDIAPNTIDATVAVTTTPTTVKQKSNILYRRIADILGAAWDSSISMSMLTLAGKFHATTGHVHSGAAGDAPIITPAPGGSAGGDLSGTYPNPTVAKIRGRSVSASTPANGDVLTYDTTATQWAPAAPTGGGGGMTNPMTTQDDIIVGGSAGTPARLAKGTDGQVLTVDPTTHHLVWSTPSGGGGGSGIPNYGDPTLQTLSWINQGSSTETTLSNDGLYLETPNAAGNHLRLRVKSAPSTPWKLTTKLIPNVNINLSGSPSFGLVFRESSSGKLHVIRVQHNSSDKIPVLIVDAWTDADTFSGSDLSIAAYLLAGGGYFRIADDGTNRLFSYGLDGINFQQIFSVARTTFLTANQIGYFVNSNSGGNPMGVTLMSWLES